MTLHRTALALGLVALACGAVAQTTPQKTYIVQLVDAPVASYTGNVPGYAATKPATGRKLDLKAPAVVAYKGLLATRQGNALSTVPAAQVVHKYSVVFNGFAARMTEAQAKMRASGLLS